MSDIEAVVFGEPLPEIGIDRLYNVSAPNKVLDLDVIRLQGRVLLNAYPYPDSAHYDAVQDRLTQLSKHDAGVNEQLYLGTRGELVGTGYRRDDFTINIGKATTLTEGLERFEEPELATTARGIANVLQHLHMQAYQDAAEHITNIIEQLGWQPWLMFGNSAKLVRAARLVRVQAIMTDDSQSPELRNIVKGKRDEVGAQPRKTPAIYGLYRELTP